MGLEIVSEVRRVDEEPGRYSLFETMMTKGAHLRSQSGEIGGHLVVDTALVGDHSRLQLLRQIVELQ